MIYNFTKCESVIAKIMADLDSSESRQRTSDIREWIFEAIEKIGAPMQYIRRESGANGVPVFEIQDYQVPLPSDLVHLDGVACSNSERGPWVPMSTMTGVFREPTNEKYKVRIINDDKNQADEPEQHLEHQPMQYKFPTTQSQLVIANNMKHHQSIIGNYVDKPEYFIKPGWIVTNKKQGYIKLSYKAIATDERGYPLIPDLTSYQEAIYWYVTMKLSFPKFLKGKLGGKLKSANMNIYFYLQQQWNFYRNQAYAEAMMPTADDMQNIKNDWNKLIPDWDGDDTFFKNTGKEQITFNDYYYGY